MKYFLLIFFGLIFNLIKAQDTLSVNFCKSKFGEITTKQKANYIIYKIKAADGTLYSDLYTIDTKQLVKREALRNNVQVGKWIYLQNDKSPIQILDYDFEINYDCTKLDSLFSIHYNNSGHEFEDAKFNDGDFREYVQRRLIYPAYAVENNIKGKVIILFLINKEGKVSEISVKKGVHGLLDKECIRVVRESSNWTPAKLDGQPIEKCYEIPLYFMIN